MASNEPAALKQSRSVKSKNSLAKSLPSTGQTSPATETFGSLPQNALLPIGSPMLMSLPEVSRAKTFPSLVGGPELMVRGPGFGQKSSAWFANYDQSSSLWRTSETFLLAPENTRADGSAEFSETWPMSGMTRNGTAFRRPLSVLHISANGFGLWPTPNKSNGFAPFSMLTMQRKKRGETRPSGCKMGFDLRWEPRCVPYLVDGWINPVLTEWLMGFPIGHTALLDAETP